MQPDSQQYVVVAAAPNRAHQLVSTAHLLKRRYESRHACRLLSAFTVCQKASAGCLSSWPSSSLMDCTLAWLLVAARSALSSGKNNRKLGLGALMQAGCKRDGADQTSTPHVPA